MFIESGEIHADDHYIPFLRFLIPVVCCPVSIIYYYPFLGFIGNLFSFDLVTDSLLVFLVSTIIEFPNFSMIRFRGYYQLGLTATEGAKTIEFGSTENLSPLSQYIFRFKLYPKINHLNPNYCQFVPCTSPFGGRFSDKYYRDRFGV